MFEQTFLNGSAKTRCGWTVAVSFAGQMAVVGLAILVPLAITDKLPRARLAFRVEAPTPALPAGPRTPPHVAIVEVHHQIREGVLREPRSVPPRAREIVDPQLPPDLGPARPGVPGGIGEPGGAGTTGVIDSLLTATQHMIAPPPPPPVPTPRHAEPAKVAQIRRGGKVQEALLVHKVIPVYPPLARQARISGTVVLHAIIGRDGRIQQLRAASGHPLLVPAALDAVRQFVYRPTLLNGEPVEVITEISVHFTLAP